MSDLFSKVEPPASKPPAKVVAMKDSYVTVELTERGNFWVQRVRGNGASAGVLYTRDELVELRRRIDAALAFEGGEE